MLNTKNPADLSTFSNLKISSYSESDHSNETSTISKTQGLGVRGGSDVGADIQTFQTITHAVESQHVDADIPNFNEHIIPTPGDNTVISLANRKFDITLPFNGSVDLEDLLKQTFLNDKVLRNYLYYSIGKITITAIPVASPNQCIGHRVLSYDPLGYTGDFLPEWVPGGVRYIPFAFRSFYVVIDLSDGKGGSLVCPNLSPVQWFLTPNVAQNNVLPGPHWPGRVHYTDIFTDSVTAVHVKFVLSVEDVKVCMPLDCSEPITLVSPQSFTCTGEDKSMNPQDRGASHQPIPTSLPSLPSFTSDDLSFDSITKCFPYYVNLGSFSTAGDAALVNLKGLLNTPLAIQDVGSERNTYYHPLQVLLSMFTFVSYDVTINLKIIKNAFQTGSFEILYGYSDGRNTTIDKQTTSTVNRIYANFTQQKDFKIVIPYVNFGVMVPMEHDNRFFKLILNDNVIPAATGVGDDVHVYALLEFSNIKCYYPRNSTLLPIIPHPRNSTLLPIIPPPSSANIVVPQSGDGDTTLDINVFNYGKCFTNFRQVMALTRYGNNSNSKFPSSNTLPTHTLVDLSFAHLMFLLGKGAVTEYMLIDNTAVNPLKANLYRDNVSNLGDAFGVERKILHRPLRQPTWNFIQGSFSNYIGLEPSSTTYEPTHLGSTLLDFSKMSFSFPIMPFRRVESI
jgi:hypothetical protein